ncbi:MAG: hypothetical protein COT71_03640 [Candidatus Andersenbacteria bacterium CG10_big_fil_rev_8_21_14_0_10_54_11]|uniref:histidine kinase n=1 Tax=Candidatus Andersenbacteria bacterium CG10_big_fil_rev_8_21_14_0_10_54_11 TaxID=1974485 RepID=A0A2M6WYM0_9BACT|nr:MAG: hypothetical protein COT71_03640 [Candidatus Andersenbacteria bacterium CG10_big_fil_rev_8_21_14_0_10_54_11]
MAAAPPKKQPGTVEQRYSELAFTSVPPSRSLFAKFTYTLAALTVTLTALTGTLTAIVHKTILEPLIPADMLAVIREELLVSLTLIGLVSLALAAGAAALLARHFTRPITQLMEAMKEVSHDNLTVRIPVKRRDELGTVTRFFNSMVQQIKAVQARNANVQKMKSQFVSAAAHQLRTPLTGLKWSLQYLLEEKAGTITAEQRQTLQQGQVVAEKMMQIVNQFLNVAKIEEGKAGLNLQAVALAPLVHRAVTAHEDEARQRGIKLQWQSSVGDHVTIVADPAYLDVIITNLLDNALIYTPTGGQVTVRLAPGKNYLTVTVEDTGIGIPPTEQAKIFSQFYRSENAKKVHTDGSGLGLFIARNIATQHGGRLWFKSQPGRGTIFYLTLPVREELLPKPESLEELLQEI